MTRLFLIEEKVMAKKEVKVEKAEQLYQLTTLAAGKLSLQKVLRLRILSL